MSPLHQVYYNVKQYIPNSLVLIGADGSLNCVHKDASAQVEGGFVHVFLGLRHCFRRWTGLTSRGALKSKLTISGTLEVRRQKS